MMEKSVASTRGPAKRKSRTGSTTETYSDALKEASKVALGKSTHQFHKILDVLPAAIYITDAQGLLTYFNSAAVKLSGRTPEIGTNKWCVSFKMFKPDGSRLPYGQSPMAIALKENRAIYGKEVILERPDGKRIWFEPYPIPLHNSKEELIGGVNMLIDITEHKRSEENLHISEERFRAIMKNSPLSKQIFDSNGNTLMANSAWEKLWQGSKKELKGYNILKDKQLEEAGLMPYIKKAFTGKTVWLPDTYYDPAKIGKKGRAHWVSGCMYPLLSKDGKSSEIALVHYDNTEQIQAINALKKSEERLALALRTSRLGLWEWNLSTNQLVWSDEIKAMFGLGADEDVTYKRYIELLHAEDRPKVEKRINQAIKDGQEYSFEHRVVRPDGSVLRVLSKGLALKENDKTVRMLGTVMDIEDMLRKRELEKEAANLAQQTSDLIALGHAKDEFISLASHQLRTPATSVKQYLAMLSDGYAGGLSHAQKDMLNTAYESNERQLHIIDNLLRVAKVDTGSIQLKPRRVDLVKLLQVVTTEQSPKLAQRGQNLRLAHKKDSLFITADEAQLHMAFENIVDNAGKYSPPRKPITATISELKDFAKVTVTDHGVGIAKSDVSKMFEKFTRINNELTDLVDGSGLGLYWVKTIVDLHNGHIKIESKPQKGTTLTVTLPKKYKTK